MDKNLKERIIRAQDGNRNELNDLVKENSGLIYNIARRFMNRGYDLEEIYQVGAIGLIKAIKKFDFNYDVMLSTFAVTFIIGEIKRFLRDDGPIKVSRQIKELSVRIKNEENIKPNIKIEELAKKLNVNEEEIVLAMDSNNMPESLEDKVDEDGLCLMDKLSSSENIEEKVINNIALRECLKKLNDREKKVIFLRYYKCQTQKKVADIIGVSQVQVSRIENAVLRNLEKELKEEA